MSDKNPFPFWNTDWLEAQRKYMEALAAFGGNAGKNDTAEQDQTASGNGAAANPWNKALEFWWQSIAQTASGETKDFYSALIDQTQSFYLVSEQISRFMQSLAEVSQSADDWQEQLDKCFEEMKEYMGRSQGDVGKTLSGMFGAWQLPMDTLQRTFSSSSVFPGDFLQGIKPDVGEVTDKFLSVPGVGYTRESQEQVQEWLRYLSRYQRTAQEYNLELSKVGVKALDIMKQRVLDMSREGEEINSLREFYDLWVDCNEQAYAEYVMSPEYSEIYGRLVNDLMALKQKGQSFMDETVSALGMPTRKGLATMQRRQQEMRRELIASRDRIEALEDELGKVNELKREINALKSARTDSRSTASSRPASKKKTAKKKAKKKASGSKQK